MSDIVNAVLIQSEIKKFRDSIESFNSQTAVQNKRMLRLTYAITFLTLVMLIAVGAQLYISIYKQNIEHQKEEAKKPIEVAIQPTKPEVKITTPAPPKEKTNNKLLNQTGAKDAPPS